MYNVQQAFVSVGESLLTMNQVSYVTIKGLRMWYSRTTAVQVSEGKMYYYYTIMYNDTFKTIINTDLLYLLLLVASNVQIVDCDISLHGTSSITLHGTDCVVQGIRAYCNGCGGIDISGGDQV